MDAAVRPGAVVAWRDAAGLAFAVVGGEEKQRTRLVLAGGREARVAAARILFEVASPGPVPGREFEARRAAGERVQAVEQRVRAVAEAVDVPLVWEIVREEHPEDSEPEVQIAALAELALDAVDGAARAAVLVALREDGLRFVRRGERWLARPPEVVEELQRERERTQRRDAERASLLARLSAAGRGAAWRASGGDEEQRALAALERLAVHEDDTPPAERELALHALEASGLRWDRPHEGAFRLLRWTGRFATDDVNLQVLRYDLRTEFPRAVVEQATAAAARRFTRDGRRDLTAWPTVSIDGPHTREIDDALSIESLGPEGLRLAVHVADPTPFVGPGDALDEEALARGQTFYMPDLRLPMLPAAVSEEAASLVEAAERPALSFIVTLDETGEVRRAEIVRSIVRCDARLDYAEADATIAAGAGPWHALLAGLDGAGRLREAARRRAGAVLIQAPEAEVRLGAGGQVVLETLPGDSPSRRAVSEAMILAGACAAQFAAAAGVPLIYRGQAAGDPGASSRGEPITDPVTVRQVRMALKRAQSSLEPTRHASLGLDAYAQVTSPLRRFADLVAHRQLAAAIAEVEPPYDATALKKIVTMTERADADARRAERAAHAYWVLRYLGERQGQAVDAVVLQDAPRTIVQLEPTLWTHPLRALPGAETGARVRLRIERVNPRAGLLVLRPV